MSAMAVKPTVATPARVQEVRVRRPRRRRGRAEDGHRRPRFAPGARELGSPPAPPATRRVETRRPPRSRRRPERRRRARRARSRVPAARAFRFRRASREISHLARRVPSRAIRTRARGGGRGARAASRARSHRAARERRRLLDAATTPRAPFASRDRHRASDAARESGVASDRGDGGARLSIHERPERRIHFFVAGLDLTVRPDPSSIVAIHSIEQQVLAASQKEMRDRISSVNSTKKITEAMKLVAAAKVRSVHWSPYDPVCVVNAVP